MQNAIYVGQLNIEPVLSNRLTQDPTLASSILGPSTLHDLTCALCGRHIFPPQANDRSRGRRALPQTSASWASTSRFLKAQAGLISSSGSSLPVSPDTLPSGVPAQTYVFRVSLPPAPNQKPSTTYPLCHGGFCLKRLRSTCELWHLVRDIVSQVWSEPEAPISPPPIHPRSATRSLSYSSIIGRPTSTTVADQIQGSNGTAPTSRRGMAGRVGNLWASGLGALSVSSRSSSPVSESKPSTSGTEPSAPPVPLRRLPPLSTDTASTSPLEIPSHPPPLPQRRHPASPAKSRIEPGPDARGHVVLEDTATVRSSGTREESGLLTPASESDGFKTPPDRELASPINEETDTILTKALATSLPTSRPTSLIVDATNADIDDSTTPKPSATDSPPSETPRAQQPTLPPAPSAETRAVSAPTPPPLPRRAAARGAVISPSPSRTGSPAPVPAPTAEPAVVPTAPQEPERAAPRLDVQTNAAVESVAPPAAESDSTAADVGSTVARSERTFSITSVSSQYSSDVYDAVRKVTPTAPQKPPMLPPRRSQSNTTNGDSRALTPANAVDGMPAGTFTDGTSWEEKTWKELVRLRENMFWARMGAVRDSEDVDQTPS